MIVVKVELWRFGDPNQKVDLGVMTITNDTTGTLTRGNYNVRLHNKKGKPYKSGRVENHARKAESIWRLVKKSVEVLVR